MLVQHLGPQMLVLSSFQCSAWLQHVCVLLKNKTHTEDGPHIQSSLYPSKASREQSKSKILKHVTSSGKGEIKMNEVKFNRNKS